MVVGNVMIWIARLRRDVAVARLVTMFAMPDVGKKLLLLPRTWNETSSVLQICQHTYNVQGLRSNLHSLQEAQRGEQQRTQSHRLQNR